MNKGRKTILVVCASGELRGLMEELNDWCEEEKQGKLTFKGFTLKNGHGVLLIEWIAPIPEALIVKLMKDRDIFDFSVYDG